MMIHPNKALKIILNTHINWTTEITPVMTSVGKVLAEDIQSNINIPPFDKSTMDGFAYHSEDNSDIFQVIETIPAGYIPTQTLKKGQCSRIMTGAVLPKGSNKVIRFEFTECNNDTVKFLKKDTDNIQKMGSIVEKDQEILHKGRLIGINEVAIMSSIGLKNIEVFKQPMIGVITTGSELTEPGEELKEGHIYNSNGPQLYNQVLAINSSVKLYDTIPDEKETIKNQITNMLEECDIVITSGGVSVGDFDFIPEILKELNFEIQFEKLLLKPGKPTLFAVKDNKYIFSLPGNPLSTYVTFELFVKPFIYKFMSHQYKPAIYQGILAESLLKSHSKRVEYVPVHFDGKFIIPLRYLGSGHISILNQANALLELNPEDKELEKGSLVNVRQL